MNKQTLALWGILAAVPATAETVSNMPEHIGFGSGAAVGGLMAGPVGVVVGGTLGTLIGHDVVSDRQLAAKTQKLQTLHQDISQARADLAALNARQAKQRAEITAFQRLLSELSVAVHFEVDSAMTASEYRRALAAVADASQTIDGLQVRLVGHADATGSAAHNARLSQARAASVGAVLTGAGARKDRLSTEARGEREASSVAACGPSALDRRVDLELSFDQGLADESLYSIR